MSGVKRSVSMASAASAGSGGGGGGGGGDEKRLRGSGGGGGGGAAGGAGAVAEPTFAEEIAAEFGAGSEEVRWERPPVAPFNPATEAICSLRA